MYQVYDRNKKKVVQDGFKSREEAKLLRDEKNEEKPDGLKIPRFVVNKDKDHYDPSRP